MNLTQTSTIEFYQNLGKIFYAIAAVDKHVRDEELMALEDIINNEWKLVEDNTTKRTAIIIDTFKWLHNDNEYNAEKCYNSFIKYINANKNFFNKKINSLILKTASQIAASFSGQNKSELMMLANLNIELKKVNN